MNLRSRLAKLSKLSAARAPAGRLTIVFARVGTATATGRPPGIYGNTGEWEADVVFDGHEPDEGLVASARARLGKSATAVVLGAEVIPPPNNYPDDPLW